MKRRLTQILSVTLAGLLQIAPMIRSALPTFSSGTSNPAWAIILKWGVGAMAMFGCHAVSKASSIAISPPNATNGQPYIGTITYAGSHSGSVSSMKLTNSCLGSATLAPGLTITYASGNKATVSGTPTTVGNLPFTLKIYDASSCGSGDTDTRATTLAIGGTLGQAPNFSSVPENGVAQIGSDVLLSAGAAGTPAPTYRWSHVGIPTPANLLSTNSILSFTNIQFANAGLYTVTASNGVGSVASATAYLSVCLTPGSDILALHATNYVAVSNALTMMSYITNAPSGSNVYKWQYGYSDITAFSTSGSNLTFAANQVFSGRSGRYSIIFNGVVGSTTVVPLQLYDSDWAFGTRPGFTAPPTDTNGTAGSAVTLRATAFNLRTPYTNQTTSFDWYFNDTNLVASETQTGNYTQVNEGPGGSLKGYIISNIVSTLTLNNLSAAAAGKYTVVASNYWGSITSSPAILNLTSTSVPPPVINPQLVAGGNSFQISFSNDPGASFTVLRSTNVGLPLSNWTVVGTATEISPGEYQFSDPGAQTNVQRYYRIRWP